jgi:hypothetical protein
MIGNGNPYELDTIDSVLHTGRIHKERQLDTRHVNGVPIQRISRIGVFESIINILFCARFFKMNHYSAVERQVKNEYQWIKPKNKQPKSNQYVKELNLL